jgi:hypothetical protein
MKDDQMVDMEVGLKSIAHNLRKLKTDIKKEFSLT